MATISKSYAVSLDLVSKKTGYNWSEGAASYVIDFGETIPEGATVGTGVVNVHTTTRPAGSSYFYLNGQSCQITSIGDHNVNVTVPSGTSSLTVVITHKGSTTSSSVSTSQFHIDRIDFTVSYALPVSSWTLTKTSVTADGTDTLGVTIVPASSTCTHTVTYAFGTASASFDLAAGVTSHTYTVPASWCEQMPSTVSDWGQVTLTTKDASGSVMGTEGKTFTATVPTSFVPTISSVSLTPINQKWGLYVQGVSSVTAAMTGASGVYGSTIVSYAISGGGYTGSSDSLTTGTLNTSGENVFAFTVKDSRGRTASTTETITVTAYSRPSMTSSALTRCNAEGTADDSGAYFSYTPVFTWSEIGENTITITVTYREGATGDIQTAYTGAVTSGQVILGGNGSLDETKSYQIGITLSDTISTVSGTKTLPSSGIYLDLQPNRLGIGCYAESDNRVKLADAWDFIYKGDTLENMIDGRGHAAPVFYRKAYDSSSFYCAAASSITITKFTPEASGNYLMCFNIKMATTASSRAFFQLGDNRISLPVNTPYPCVNVFYIGDLTVGTEYPLIFYTESGGTFTYESIVFQYIKMG